MKSILLFCLMNLAISLSSQDPVELIEGNTDQVLKIETNFTGNMDIIGLKARSETGNSAGIGGRLLGGYIGLQSAIIGATDIETYAGSFLNTHSGIGNKFGIMSEADGTTNNIYGIFARASLGTDKNVAVRGQVFGTGERYGIYAKAPIDPTRNSFAGYFTGDIVVTGTIYNLSDARVKKNIEPLDNPIEALMSYDLNGDPEGVDFAKKLHSYFPSLINERQPDYLEVNAKNRSSISVSIDWIGLIPFLTKAIQVQNVQIKENDEKLKYLRDKVQLYYDEK